MSNIFLRREIAEILGLETSPDGEPFHLLTRDESDNILEGVDYSDEVEQLAALIEAALRMHQVQFERANRLDAALREREDVAHAAWTAEVTRADKAEAQVHSFRNYIRQLTGCDYPDPEVP